MYALVKKITGNHLILTVLSSPKIPTVDIRLSNKLSKGYTRIMSLDIGSEIIISNNAIINIGKTKEIRNKEYDQNNGWYVKIQGNECTVYNSDNELLLNENSMVELSIDSDENKIEKII